MDAQYGSRGDRHDGGTRREDEEDIREDLQAAERDKGKGYGDASMLEIIRHMLTHNKRHRTQDAVLRALYLQHLHRLIQNTAHLVPTNMHGVAYLPTEYDLVTSSIVSR